MIRVKSIRVGILFAVAVAGTLSCGESNLTGPNPKSEIIVVQTFEQYLNSTGQESRELLIDSRVTDIEWNISGNPNIVLVKGSLGSGGGNYHVSLRSLWTLDKFGDPVGFYLLLEWPDRTRDVQREPLVTNANVRSDSTATLGDTLINCKTGDDTLVRESSWSRSSLQEDEVYVEIFSDSPGPDTVDVWRWGAATTDPVTPVNGSEFVGAVVDGDTLGSNSHPAAGYMEDFIDWGAGPVRDQGDWTYMRENTNPGSNVPLFIASKGTRDTRLNRGKPVDYVLWNTVARPFGPCDIDNPVRVDNAGERDKTWNPGDIVPSFRAAFPSESQLDVIARGGWQMGKWALEIRRDLISRYPEVSGVPGDPRPDDVKLIPGNHYLMRITIVDGATRMSSRSPLMSLYLRP